MSKYLQARDEAAGLYGLKQIDEAEKCCSDCAYKAKAVFDTNAYADRSFKAGADWGVFKSPEVLALESALFLLLKRVTKLGAIKAEPDSPIDRGWKALDAYEAARREVEGC